MAKKKRPSMAGNVRMLMYGTMLALLMQGCYEIGQDLFTTYVPALPHTNVILISMGITGAVLYFSYWYNYVRPFKQKQKKYQLEKRGIVVDESYQFDLNGMSYSGVVQEVNRDDVRIYYKAIDGYYRDVTVPRSAIKIY